MSTNDIQNNVNILRKIRKGIPPSKKDYDSNDKINGTNRKLENLSRGKGMTFINNSNIDSTCLNRSKLHLNKIGTSLLIKNLLKVVNCV